MLGITKPRTFVPCVSKNILDSQFHKSANSTLRHNVGNYKTAKICTMRKQTYTGSYSQFHKSINSALREQVGNNKTAKNLNPRF